MGDFAVQLERSRGDGKVAVMPAGELDLAAAPVLEAHLLEVESGPPSVIVLDLTGVGFIDSTGLRVLLAAAARARDGGWRLQIASPAEQVSKLLELTGSEDVLEILD